MANSFNITDEDMIRGLKNREDFIIKLFYKMHYPMVLNFVINNNGTADEAKDVFQEAVIVIYNNLLDSAFELRCKLKTYLYSISRRMWLNELKSKKRHTDDVYDYEEFIEFEKQEEDHFHTYDDQFKIIDESLKQLGEPCGTILKDFYLHKASMEDIVQKMGYTNTDNAKNQKYKCLQRLKKIFFTIYQEKHQPEL